MLFVIQREPVSQISRQFEVFAFSGQYIFATTVNIYHPIKYYWRTNTWLTRLILPQRRLSSISCNLNFNLDIYTLIYIQIEAC